MERQSAEWMRREDERILEYLEENGLSSSRLISNEAFEKVSPGHVAEHLERLRYARLVSRTGLTSYELTREGRWYLDGDLDAAHQPTPTTSRVFHS